MKKAILYIVLLSYTLLMLKPVAPYVSDCIAHVFFYAKHMATVHYENGKYHVHYETAKNAKEESADKTANNTTKKDTASNEHIISQLKQPAFIAVISVTKYNPAITPDLISSTPACHYPPPRI